MYTLRLHTRVKLAEHIYGVRNMNALKIASSTRGLRCVYIAQERHNKLIRANVTDRLNYTNLEQGLQEDLIVAKLDALQAEPPANGFLNAHNAPRVKIAKLVDMLGCTGVDVETCVEARCGAIRAHRGDVILYMLDDMHMRAGELFFFASAQGWEESAFVSAWQRAPARDKSGSWSFDVLGGLVQVPVRYIRDTVTAHVGANTATVICSPALLM